jgi:MarR family transcriptional regulator, organic hydroperoxide resistance regulator
MPVPNTAPPTIGLGRLMREASTAFNRVFKAKLAPMGISYGQFQYLQGLWEGDGLTQTELTRKVGVEMAASTAILDSLEKRKLIKRVRNSSDRRKIEVYLTAAGAGLKDQLLACAIDANKVARQGVSNASMMGLFDTLGRVIRNLENAQMPTDDDSDQIATAPKAPRRRRGQRQSLVQ